MTPMLLTAQTPAPQPTEMELWEVTPGIEGFILGFFVLALACIPLFRSMVKHMRRVDHNQRLLERAEAAGRDVDADTAAGATRPAVAADAAAVAGAEPGAPEPTGGPGPTVPRPGTPASPVD